MQAYRPLKECLFLSLQYEPLTKNKVLLNEVPGAELTPDSSIDKIAATDNHIVESTRL